MSPIVSIIIPVYNTAAYLRRCLESARNQTLENIEIICINDGSTDNSLEILEEYASIDSRISVISTPNRGLGAARNIGLEMAKGTWVTGLDSDDYLELDACSYVLEHDLTGVDVVKFGFKVKHNESFETTQPCHLNGKHEVNVNSLIHHSCEFCGKFWRKSFIDKYHCRFPLSVWYEDCFFYWAYLPFAKRVLYLSECKYVIVRRASSIMAMSRNHSVRVLDHVRVLEKLLDFRAKYPLAEKNRQLNLINFIQCVRFVESRLSEDYHEQADEMFRILSCHPLMKSWRKWVCDNSRCKFKRLFIKIKPGEIAVGLCGFFPLKVRVELDMIVWRFFGVGLIRYRIGY